MTVLVAVASRHGSTWEIAEEIGRVLGEHGLDAKVAAVDDVDDVAPFDAVVLGSAVYMGRWLEPASAFVEEHAGELAARPTWLFSSGPIGDPPQPEGEQAVRIEEIVTAAHAREHAVFAGKLDKNNLGLVEKATARVVRAAEGDFRDWPAIEAWASAIATALRSEPVRSRRSR